MEIINKKEELIGKLTTKLFDLLMKSGIDETLYGNSIWDISGRKIELLDPKKVRLTINKKGKTKPEKFIVCYDKLPNKLYGKSILESKFKKKKNGTKN